MRLIWVVALAAATAVMLAIGSGSAVADQHNQRSCEAAGGTWTNLGGGQKKCVFTEEEDGKNDRFKCTTEETTSGGPGNLKPHKNTETDTTEEGEGTGSGKCPPGQFRNG